jgi:hypothetical protein
MRLLADIACPRKGPGPTLVFGGAGRLADFVVVAVFQFETAIVAAGPVDRGLDRPVSWLDHAGAADAGDAAIVLDPRGHRALEPADGARGGIGRVVEAPGPAAPVALAQQRAVRGIPGLDRRAQIVAAGTVEIGLGLRRSGAKDDRKDDQKARHDQSQGSDQPTRSHPRPLSTGKSSGNAA